MTTAPDSPLMSAQNPDESIPTDGTHREGVTTVALFESRKGRVTRAWDELSEIDRAVLLETVRQRRKLQQQKQRIDAEIYRMRSNR